MSQKQRFLFLQGVCSPFFPRLAQALRDRSHSVRKVNFTVGDRIYWRAGEATTYRGPMDQLDAFYDSMYERHGISDIVLFGDCRPVHRSAIQVAQARDIRVHVFEEGYFRPYWITLERNGVNGHSCLPRDPAWYREQSKNLPDYDNGTPFSSPFWKRAAYDVGYNFWAGLNPILHPGVRSHVPYSPLTEYLGYARRGVRMQWMNRASRETEQRLIYEAPFTPFYLLPLQLATDAQITHHSPFADMTDALRFVLQSFAHFAPDNTRLAVKIHPLDPGLIDYRAVTRYWARILGVADRIFYLESGNLPALLAHTAGLVTVNSTVGASALIHNRPAIALGTAIYDMPGLTYQGNLDSFWTEAQKPDAKLFRCFRNVVIQRSQVNGGFYSTEAINLAIANCIPKLTDIA